MYPYFNNFLDAQTDTNLNKISRVDPTPEEMINFVPTPKVGESAVLQSFLEKILGAKASSDELDKYVSSPESYTPMITFSKPILPTAEVTPVVGIQSPFGFFMVFLLENCQGVGRVKADDESSHSLMVFSPPSQEAKDIEDIFSKFGVKLTEACSINSKISETDFSNICKENLSFIVGGNALYL